MKPREARKRLLILIITLFLLCPVYFFLSATLDFAILDVLFYAAVISIVVAYFLILNKYYRCTKCGRRLTVGKTVFLGENCPYCKAKIE